MARFSLKELAYQYPDEVMDGEEPQAPWLHDSYHTRPGSWIAAEGVQFEDVLVERFGDPLGRVNSN